MADYMGIYEAGEALIALLKKNMTPEPISKPELIGLCVPHEPEDYQLTLYLYHVEDATRMGGAAFTQESQNVQRAAPLPLKLYYLITAHSKAPVQSRAADEHRILGRALQIVRDNAQLSGAMLSGSLKENTAELRVTLRRETHEQLTKIFPAASSKPYKLSFAIEVEGVEIDSNRTRSFARVKDAAFSVEELTEEKA
ncbi:DUF4255 domain-containing protein [Christensenellaceae bacterium OttesenSCG-928-M15]|nr:DUF4255 domain-containing protein [Christensenellaceae bacterium OttesenSCG-928-M15]